MIGEELAIDEKYVNYIMINYLGFDPEEVKDAWSSISTTYYDMMNEQGMSEDDIYSNENIKCSTIADNGYEVFQLMDYDSDLESGIEGDSFSCLGEFFASDEDDALQQLEQAKLAVPRFAKLAKDLNLYVQPYNEHFSTGGEIYQNVSAIAQHLNQDFHDEEIPFV